MNDRHDALLRVWDEICWLRHRIDNPRYDHDELAHRLAYMEALWARAGGEL